jgi:hypothetical protein
MVELPLLVNLFNVRLRLMHTSPESPEVDQLLVKIISTCSLVDKPPVGVDADYTIPIYRLKSTGGVDVLTLIRLLPAYLRYQQSLMGQQISGDMTLQPRTALRVAYVLRAAEIQGASFPKWFSHGLQTIVAPCGKFDVSLSSETDRDNMTSYWMRILLQIASWYITHPMSLVQSSDEGKIKSSGSSATTTTTPSKTASGLDDEKRNTSVLMSLQSLIGSLKRRLCAIALKFYLINDITSDIRVPYRVPTYPGTKPFIDDHKSPMAYIVWRDATSGVYLDADTKEAMGTAPREIIDPKAIETAWARNYLMCGAYVRTRNKCHHLLLFLNFSLIYSLYVYYLWR